VTTDGPPCPVCGAGTTPLGEWPSTFSGRVYRLRRCPACAFSFVENPWTDFATIYSPAYYDGRGADPHVDYRFEFERPGDTVRQYEWRGLARMVGALVPVTASTRWLDYGCGHGGFVRHLRGAGVPGAFGYDTGSMAATARDAGLPVLTDAALDEAAGSFDIVTMIEVIEHVPDPVALLRRVRTLLRPGGLLVLTTGNAAPYRGRMRAWSYVLPDVHVSFFEPATLARALDLAGFRPELRGWLPGVADVIRFKVLKAVRVRRAALWERAVPWSLVSRVVDWRLGVSAHPVGWAR
jgi:SAM-dependent methyltransferase